MIACYLGLPDAGERIVAPLRQFGPPLLDTISPIDYLDVIQLLDAGNPLGHHYYKKGCSVPHLTDEVIDAIVAAGAAPSSPYSLVLNQHLHGAASRVTPDATAFALRGEYYLPLFIAHWTDGAAERHIAWSRAAWAALRPFASDGTYVNFMVSDEAARVRPAYGENYKRLVAIKNTYGPTNFFRANQNIQPSAPADTGW